MRVLIMKIVYMKREEIDEKEERGRESDESVSTGLHNHKNPHLWSVASRLRTSTISTRFKLQEYGVVSACILSNEPGRKKIHNDTILTKELVRKLSGFFMLEENCRGYDPNTPIGEIAKHAFLHWREFEKYRLDCKEKAEQIERKNNTIARMYERGFALEEQIQKNKRKRCCRC